MVFGCGNGCIGIAGGSDGISRCLLLCAYGLGAERKASLFAVLLDWDGSMVFEYSLFFQTYYIATPQDCVGSGDLALASDDATTIAEDEH